METFAITIRKHGKKSETIKESDYQPILAHIGEKLSHHVFEKDKNKDHCHVHGIVKLARGFYRKNLTLKGFNIKFVHVFDLDGWLKYMKKDVVLRAKTRFEIWTQDADDEYQASRKTTERSEGRSSQNLFSGLT